ncbi:MAG: efflux RND transporter periplasmic adaptor subunit, partial [Aquabacterium sp.]|nr:efflux RND transporter periplasmic adaptor subunit [Aquabacterium sp.]
MTNTQTKPLRRFGFRQRHRHRGYRLLLVTALALLTGLLYLLYWWNFASRFVVTNDAYVTGNLASLKAQTSGTVVDVRVDNTQYVHQGDVLVRLDGLQAQVALERAEANLADSVRQIETLFSQADVLRQKMAAKQAILNRSRRDLVRYRSVAGDGAVSAQQIEDSEFQVRELEADVLQIRAELGGAEALIQNTSPADNPKVLQAVAGLKQAYLDRTRQEIVAPVSGFVAKRSIQPGEQVRPETSLLAIVPLDYLWVEANFLENELADVQPGQPAEITVDLYGSDVVYHGEVLGLGAGTGSVFGLLPPDNATGNYIHIVERVPV